MLKKLRSKKTAKKIWIILAVIIVPAFVFWGLGGALRSQKETAYAGKIFGKKISLLDYQDALEAVKNQAIILYGDEFSQKNNYPELEAQAWERLILLYEAKKRKITVSDKEVVDLIQRYPFLQRNAKFNQQLYSEMLRYVFRAQPRVFEEQTRQNLTLSKLYNQVTQNLKVSAQEIKEEYKKFNEEISIYYLASLPADSLKDITAGEDQIKDYFLKNSLKFKQPPSFNIEYVSLDSEEKTKSIISYLNKKADFAKIAGQMGAEVKVTGFFSQNDPVPGIGWSPQILNLLSKLKIGQFSVPIRLDKNYYILRLKEKKEAYIADFEKIKDKVKEMFVKEEAVKTAKTKIEACLKINPRQIDFAALAKTYNLKSDSTNLFKYGSYIEGIGASDNLWLAAEKLKEGDYSGIIEMPSGFYIIKLKSRVAVEEKKFESEKDKFGLRLLAQKKQEYFAAFIEELKRKAQMF